ncbi:MAG: hypothetical protein LUC34_00445 [Campylobacter sp.]|nr:hypothetical protein [Campylobacter sp.]
MKENKTFKELCWSTKIRKFTTTLVLLLLAFTCYNAFILPYAYTWGANKQEINMQLHGDKYVPDEPSWQVMTNAITINAPVETVFKYFVQMGQDKGGFYSFDWLERLFGFEIYNTYIIKPQWQNLQAGDFVTFHPSGMGMRVQEFEPNDHITLVTNGLVRDFRLPEGKWEMFLDFAFDKDKGEYAAWNWDFNFIPLENGTKTRVLIRWKVKTQGGAVKTFLAKHFFSLPSCIMNIEMLKRVKALSEGTYKF